MSAKMATYLFKGAHFSLGIGLASGCSSQVTGSRSQAAGHRSTKGKTDCSTSSWLLVVEWFLVVYVLGM